MKKGVLAFAIASVVVGSPVSFPFQRSFPSQQTSIAGRISPYGGVKNVSIVSRRDSIRVTVIDGNFIALVKPGRYKLLIQGRAPYKSAQLDNLEVKQNQALDIGEIILQ